MVGGYRSIEEPIHHKPLTHPNSTQTQISLKMSAADNKPAGLPVAALAKGFATASMLFNFAALPLTSMPEAAAAKAGEGPKQSVFGLGGDAASSPFVEDVPTYSPYCESRLVPSCLPSLSGLVLGSKPCVVSIFMG